MEAPKIITTSDTSHSLYIPSMNEHYHSVHGAVQESLHVFIDAGLKQMNKKKISLFEVGLGTGLNAFLSLVFALENQISIHYSSIEKYPLQPEIYDLLNYGEVYKDGNYFQYFKDIHSSTWDKPVSVHPLFILHKIQGDIIMPEKIEESSIDLIYFDAFGPSKQPEMWTEDVFYPLVQGLKKEGIITTYAATGAVRRLWQQLGLSVERIPGPPGKREMLRGRKI